jgi:hypothetical protein
VDTHPGPAGRPAPLKLLCVDPCRTPVAELAYIHLVAPRHDDGVPRSRAGGSAVRTKCRPNGGHNTKHHRRPRVLYRAYRGRIPSASIRIRPNRTPVRRRGRNVVRLGVRGRWRPARASTGCTTAVRREHWRRDHPLWRRTRQPSIYGRTQFETRRTGGSVIYSLGRTSIGRLLRWLGLRVGSRVRESR